MTHRVDFQPATRCKRGGFEAGMNLRDQLVEAFVALSSDSPGRLGVRWNDVRRIASLVDDAVNRIVRVQRWSQSRDIHIGLNKGVECIDTDLWGERCV